MPVWTDDGGPEAQRVRAAMAADEERRLDCLAAFFLDYAERGRRLWKSWATGERRKPEAFMEDLRERMRRIEARRAAA